MSLTLFCTEIENDGSRSWVVRLELGGYDPQHWGAGVTGCRPLEFSQKIHVMHMCHFLELILKFRKSDKYTQQ